MKSRVFRKIRFSVSGILSNFAVNKAVIMSSQFNSYIDRIDADFWQRLCKSRGQLRHYDKGEEFISAGTIGRYIGYVESGALKYVCYSSDGTPHVVGLEFAGHFVCDFPGSLYQQKSRCSIIATVPCDIYCVSSSWVAEQMNTDIRFKEIVDNTTREIFATLYDRHINLYSKSPLKRYKELISHDPNLFNYFSLKDIASLLNITPTHLSRLRKS